MAPGGYSRSQNHGSTRFLVDASSDEEELSTASMSVGQLAQAALALQDLGSARRDYITTIDPTATAVNFVRLNRNRKCNIDGTNAAEAAQKNAAQTSAWNDPTSFGDDLGPGITDIGQGQTHRERITREVTIERAAMQERGLHGDTGIRCDGRRGPPSSPAKRSRGKKSVYHPTTRPLDPALHSDGEYDPIAAAQARKRPTQRSVPASTARSCVKTAKNALRHAAMQRPAFDPSKLQSNPVLTSEAASGGKNIAGETTGAMKLLLEKRKIGSISQEDFENAFWAWRFETPSTETRSAKPDTTPDAVNTLAAKTEQTIDGALFTTNAISQAPTEVSAFSSGHSSEDPLLKHVVNPITDLADNVQHAISSVSQVEDNSSQFMNLVTDESPLKQPSQSCTELDEVSPLLTIAHEDVKLTDTQEQGFSISHPATSNGNFQLWRHSPSVSDVTERLSSLNIKDMAQLENPFDGRSPSLHDNTELGMVQMPSPRFIPELPKPAPPDEIVLNGYRYRIIEENIPKPPEVFRNPFLNVENPEHEIVKNTTPVSSLGVSSTEDSAVGKAGRISHGRYNEGRIHQKSYQTKGEPMKGGTGHTGLNVSKWSVAESSPQQTPSSGPRYHATSPGKYYKTGGRGQYIGGGDAFLNLVKEMQAKGETPASLSAKAHGGFRLPLRVLDQIQTMPPKR